jgi:hypothetical protein
MVCKAIIDAKLTNYKLRVRIPSLHSGVDSIGAVGTESIPIATVSIAAGIYPALKVGDVVFVTFEDDNPDKPVIVGLLYSDKCKTTLPDIVTTSLEVITNAKLPQDTQIGEITSTQVSYLKNISSDVQTQFNNLDKRTNDLEDEVAGAIYTILTAVNSKLEDLM